MGKFDVYLRMHFGKKLILAIVDWSAVRYSTKIRLLIKSSVFISILHVHIEVLHRSVSNFFHRTTYHKCVAQKQNTVVELDEHFKSSQIRHFGCTIFFAEQCSRVIS